jgi:amidohydrolase
MILTQEIKEQIILWRRTFHRYPELSRAEDKTASRIVKILKEIGNIEIQTFTKHFGVCATITGSQPGPVIAFRADMDALPIQEETAAEYASEIPGIMHACGHDGHMAILLGLAALFSKNKENLSGTIKLIFQPAEEASPLGGAQEMMDEGLLEGVSAIFGLHVWPDIACGEIGIRSGALMAASDRFKINILGQGAHAGQPQNGIDSIGITADILQDIGRLIDRQIDPLETATICVGTIRGGERYNVIAREVVLEGTVRTLGEKVRQDIPKKMQRLLEGITAAHGAKYKLDYQYGYPVLANCEEPTNLVIEAAGNIIPHEAIHTNVQPVLAAEDFGRYLTKYPGAFFWLGCAKKGGPLYKLHNASFDLDEDALSIGVEILYQTGLKALSNYK